METIQNVSNLHNRIMYLINLKAEGAKARFCNETGIAYGFWRNITNRVQSKTIRKILDTYRDINPEWLLNGTGKVFKNNPADKTAEYYEYTLELQKKYINALEKENYELKKQLKNGSK